MASEQPAGYVCDGCGRLARDPEQDMQKLREDNFLSCCPERKMLPVYTRPAPAATDTGLVTVAKQWKVTAKNWSGLKPDISEPFDERELVTRSQAEELLAAEREKVLFLKTAMEIAQTHCGLKDKTIDSLEADNAALIHDLNRIKDHETELVNDNEVKDREIERLTKSLIIEEQLNAAKAARIKELEADRDHQSKLSNKLNRSHAALEAKLAAAEKTLEPLAGIADLIDAETEGMAETDELVLHFHDYEFAKWPVSLFRKARAALGGQKRPWEFKDDEHDL
ncbi:hypothetical protein R5W60_05335 [Brucella pseudintermedia]|uniref:hypothetical protein n=1 Tax=Brucella pseudintermedia TaxID=370111 RepID=UPI003672AE12|nr:hypothetical protein R5W60_04010 [Brucella pseudintermedia]WPM81120.1 hypothetical protein R5W60_05335 [Brucella pseudintermedia]